MKNIFYFILTFCILFKGESKAQESSKDVSITASGIGKTLDIAKQTALRSAIEQAFGTFISAKTEILNDEMISDQIASVSSGNIKSFEMLNESQLPDGSWGVTLKAIVSVDKLTSFVQAKGVVVEIKGGLFATNIKQQILNEKAEIVAVENMVGILHEIMQTAFDYEIKTNEPKSLDLENKNWQIKYEVFAKPNANMNFCIDYIIKTLKIIGLTENETNNYKSINKKVYQIKIDTGDGHSYSKKDIIFNLRKFESVEAINALILNWKFYSSLYVVKNGIKETIGKTGSYEYFRGFKFIEKFVHSDNLTLSEIENLTKYEVSARGIVSAFKYGGYLVKENSDSAIVLGFRNLGTIDNFGRMINDVFYNEAKELCENSEQNGYNDWKLPSIEELKEALTFLKNNGIGWTKEMDYHSGTEDPQRPNDYFFITQYGQQLSGSQTPKYVRPVRIVRLKSPSIQKNTTQEISYAPDSLVYINSLKCKLVIRNKKENSFEYTLYNECQTGACSGLDNFEGEASTTDTGQPPFSMFEEPGVIKFTFLEDGKVLNAEPDYNFVGNDCSNSGDFVTEFELLPNPKEGELTKNENGKSFSESDTNNLIEISNKSQTNEPQQDNIELSSDSTILTMIFEDFSEGDYAHLFFIDISNGKEFDFRFLSDNNLSGLPILLDDADAAFGLKANPDYLKKTFIVEIKKKLVKDSDFDGNVFETMEWVISSIKLK
jgi:hypothetical protein